MSRIPFAGTISALNLPGFREHRFLVNRKLKIYGEKLVEPSSPVPLWNLLLEIDRGGKVWTIKRRVYVIRPFDSSVLHEGE